MLISSPVPDPASDPVFMPRRFFSPTCPSSLDRFYPALIRKLGRESEGNEVRGGLEDTQVFARSKRQISQQPCEFSRWGNEGVRGKRVSHLCRAWFAARGRIPTRARPSAENMLGVATYPTWECMLEKFLHNTRSPTARLRERNIIVLGVTRSVMHCLSAKT